MPLIWYRLINSEKRHELVRVNKFIWLIKDDASGEESWELLVVGTTAASFLKLVFTLTAAGSGTTTIVFFTAAARRWEPAREFPGRRRRRIRWRGRRWGRRGSAGISGSNRRDWESVVVGRSGVFRRARLTGGSLEHSAKVGFLLHSEEDTD